MRTGPAILVLVGLASGCSGGPATDTLQAPPVNPPVRWGRLIQSPEWFAQYPRNHAAVLPVPDHPVVLAGTSSRATGAVLEAVRGDDGTSLWRKTMPGPVEAPGVVDGDFLFIGTVNGSVHRIHLPTGTDLWEPPVQLESAVSTSPLLVADPPVLVVRDAADRLTALDPVRGQSLWSRQRPLPVGAPTLRGAPDPVLAGGLIIAGFADGTVEALAPGDGSVRWTRRLCQEKNGMNDADLTPIPLADGAVLAGCHSRGVARLSALDGEVLKTALVPGPLFATLHEGRILLATSSGKVLALEPASLDILWETELGQTPMAAPRACGDVLTVPIDRGLAVLSAEGLPLLELATAYGLSAPAACLDGDLLLITDGGVLVRTGPVP
ncbi:MAG: PQQ-binding-like beta-propeller repeat protein [Deltaproteobacteria bacterium]|nr:PQQ-binding-like beta-propeller repeat protein [Deltaproteobacteria bacterium]